MIICVIFDLGMAVIMFLFGISFVKSNGKAAAFLSGYNMKSTEERKQYDEKEMCRVYGNRMMWMALPFVAGAAIDLLYSGIGCFAACVISVSYTHLDVYKRQGRCQWKFISYLE